MKQQDIDVGLKSTATLPTLLLAFLLVALLMESVHAYENHQYGFSINPPEGWTYPNTLEPALYPNATKPVLFVFRDPSNYTGATIRVVVNQSGLPQDDPFLASRTHGYLIRYLAQTYPGYLITERGAKAVYNLNGYEIRFNATVDGKAMRFDSVIFVETNQTFYIVCGALSPAYDALSSAFDESINSFRLAPFSQGSTIYTPQDNAMWVWIGTIAVIAVSVAPSLIYFFRRKQNQKLHLANKNTKCGESSN